MTYFELCMHDLVVRGHSFMLVDDPEPSWRFGVKVVDILKFDMYLLCKFWRVSFRWGNGLSIYSLSDLIMRR